MPIPIANEYYVTVKIPHGLLGEIKVRGVPSGKTRTHGGEVEAELICISKPCPNPKIWITKDMLITQIDIQNQRSTVNI